MRKAYALEQLVDQVMELRPDAEVTYGEPDALDVVRQVCFDKDTADWLAPMFELNMDERIAEAIFSGGKLQVTFQSSSPLADNRASFALAEVDAILNGADPETEQGAQQVEPLSFSSKAEAEAYADEHGFEIDKSLKAEPYKEAVLAEAAARQQED